MSLALAGPVDDAVAGAEKIAAAMTRDDWDVALAAMDHKVLKQLGVDPADLAIAVEGIKKQMTESGVRITGCEVHRPAGVHELESYDVIFLPITTRMTVQDQKIRSKGFLVAVLYKDARDWVYVDAASMEREDLLRFYPELPKDVKLPERKTEIEKVP